MIRALMYCLKINLYDSLLNYVKIVKKRLFWPL